MIRAARAARSARSVPVASFATLRGGASRRPRGRAASMVLLALVALVAMVGLLAARPVGAISAGGAAVAHPRVEVASAGRSLAATPMRIGLGRSVPRRVPKVRPGHDTTHLVRSVPLPPGWLAASVAVAVLLLISLVALVEPVEPMAPARAAARGRGPPMGR